MNPGLLTFALAPAVPGVVSIALGVGLFQVLVRNENTPEEAAVRMFGAAFILLGWFFVRQAFSSRAVIWAIVDLALVAALVIPFHFWWVSPWRTFATSRLALDLALVIVVQRLIVAIWRLSRRRDLSVARQTPSQRALVTARTRWRACLLLFSVLAFMVGWTSAQLSRSSWTTWNDLVEVNGVVVRQQSFSFRNREGGPTVMTSVIVQYTFGDQRNESVQPIDPSSPFNRKGARITLLVDPENPKLARPASAYHLFLIPFVLLLLTMFFFGMTAISASRIGALRVL